MESSWGDSWGDSWGQSWGDPDTVDDDGGGLPPEYVRTLGKTKRQRIEEDDEECIILGMFD